MSVRDYAHSHKWIFRICATLCVLGLACMFYLTLRPSPDFASLHLPKWMLQSAVMKWLDHYGELRNLPAFLVLAVPFRVIFRDRVERWAVLSGLFFLSTAVEVAQIWIPTRCFDLMDILFSWIGLSLGWVGTKLLMRLYSGIKRSLLKPRVQAPSSPTRPLSAAKEDSGVAK